MTSPTTTREFFEEKYKAHVDPWDFASSAYEQSRYAAILRALSGRRYDRALEPGCSIGILTSELAGICTELHAMDFSPTAVAVAQERCRDLANVHIECGALPEQIPPGSFDLIVFSEIGYYFTQSELLELGRSMVERLRPHGVLLAVHWLGESKDHLLSGEQVHQGLASLNGLAHELAESHAGFRLDRWLRIPS